MTQKSCVYVGFWNSPQQRAAMQSETLNTSWEVGGICRKDPCPLVLHVTVAFPRGVWARGSGTFCGVLYLRNSAYLPHSSCHARDLITRLFITTQRCVSLQCHDVDSPHHNTSYTLWGGSFLPFQVVLVEPHVVVGVRVVVLVLRVIVDLQFHVVLLVVAVMRRFLRRLVIGGDLVTQKRGHFQISPANA